jgi:hypothetical protein
LIGSHMMDPASLTIAGLKMAWNGVKWALHRNKAPWSAADVSATLNAFDFGGWHMCVLRFSNDKPFVLEIDKFRTVKPANLMIRQVDNELGQQMVVGSEQKQPVVNWRVGASTGNPTQMTRHLFIKLPSQKRPIEVVLEFDMTLANNRRDRFTVLVKTNPID